METADSGEILFYGQPVRIKSPAQAVKMGIAVLTQEMNVYPDRDIANNVWTNHEPTNTIMVDRTLLYKKTTKLLEQLEIPLDPRMLVSKLGLAEKQMVQVARMLAPHPHVIILDEPTEVLDAHYTSVLFRLIQRLKTQGVSVVYITHKIDEITRICDRVSILKEQTIAETMEVNECDVHRLVTKLFGHIETSAYPKLNLKLGEELLRVCNLTYGNILHDISFTIRRSEILGLAGAVGSGRSTLVKTIYGAVQADSGEIYIRGEKAHIGSPSQATKNGIGYICDERIRSGLFPQLDISSNIISGNLDTAKSLCFVSPGKIKQVGRGFIKRLGIKVYNAEAPIDYLSGGNQQKVVIGKCVNMYSSLVIMDEPTSGLDIASKGDFYNIMNEFVRNGTGILFISSNISELLGMCDRILVMNKGRIVEQFYHNSVSAERLLNSIATES